MSEYFTDMQINLQIEVSAYQSKPFSAKFENYTQHNLATSKYI